MNAIPKYPHIIELSASIPNMFVVMCLFPIKCIISLGIYLIPKQSNLLHILDCLFFLGKLSLE